MPTYDYKCEKCGHQFEVFQSMKARRLSKCPQEGCDGKVKRLLGTGAGIIFKGSGFYETDYRSDSYQKAAKNDQPASSSDGDQKKESQSPKKPKESKVSPSPSEPKSKTKAKTAGK